MIGQVGVLINASTGLVADVTDEGVLGSDARELFEVDLVRILRQPLSGKHDDIIWFRLRRFGSEKAGQRCEQQDAKKSD
jgi:hypothetical protein